MGGRWAETDRRFLDRVIRDRWMGICATGGNDGPVGGLGGGEYAFDGRSGPSIIVTRKSGPSDEDL